MKEKKLTMTVPLAICILSFIAGCISYFFIKNPIPVHWNVNWEIDGTAPKEVVFLLSIAPLLLYLLLGSRMNSYTTRRGNRISVSATVYLLIAVQWFSIAAAFKPNLDASLLFPCIIGITFMVVGNYLPTVTQNHTVGMRTTWAYRSELSWKKTNRLAGYVISIFGLMLIAGGVFRSIVINLIAAVGAIIAVIILIYLSYYYWKKDPERR